MHYCLKEAKRQKRNIDLEISIKLITQIYARSLIKKIRKFLNLFESKTINYEIISNIVDKHGE